MATGIKKTTQQFIEEATIKHNGFYTYPRSEYKGDKKLITITCPIHGDFDQRAANHLQGNKCKECVVKAQTMQFEEFVKKANKIHNSLYTYVACEMRTDNGKRRNIATIICNKHGVFEQRTYLHLKGQGCKECAVEHRTKGCVQFKTEAHKIHKNFYDYSKINNYKNNRTKVTIICPKHGEFKQVPYDHLNGKGCRDCAIEKTTQALKFSRLEFIDKSNIIHNYLYTYPKTIYENSSTIVTITCQKHGDFDQLPSNHLKGHGCPHCSGNKKKTTEQFIQEATIKHNGFYTYSRSDYKNANKKVTITCPKHGDFDQTPSNHLNFSHGCPRCFSTISKPSQQWLDYLGIPNIMGETREVKLKLGAKTITVDGYDPQTNTVYEFHGDFWHGNPAIYDLNARNTVNNKTYGELFAETAKRTRLITSHGYNFVFIWESDWRKIQKELEPQAAK